MTEPAERHTQDGLQPARRWRFPFFARILTAMVLGALVGRVLGKQADLLGEFGKVIINLIKTLAAPLLFFAVVDAFLRTHIRARSGVIMLGITAVNACLAVLIGLTLSNTLRPGEHMKVSSTLEASTDVSPAGAHRIEFWKEVAGYIPTSLVRPFLENSIISIILLALLSGMALRFVKNEQRARGDDGYVVVEQLVATLYRAIEVSLGWVIALVPLAVFGVVARTIGSDGFSPLLGLAAYVGVALLGLAIQVLVVYQAWVVLVSGRSLREFWSGARDAVVYALGSSSSLATLPVTLRCLDQMKVSPQSARLAACVGTNLNNDGILLYEAMAVLFVAQVYGIHLGVGQQLVTAASCVVAGVGIAAVPDAGLISLSLVLTTVGLPIEILPILLTVDWLLSRARAVTNVTSDILVAVLLERFRTDGDRAATTADDAGEWTTGPSDREPDEVAVEEASRPRVAGAEPAMRDE